MEFTNSKYKFASIRAETWLTPKFTDTMMLPAIAVSKG